MTPEVAAGMARCLSPGVCSEGAGGSFLIEVGAAGSSSPASDNFVLGRELEQGHHREVLDPLHDVPIGASALSPTAGMFGGLVIVGDAWQGAPSLAWNLQEVCHSCGSEYMPDANYCRKCGQKRDSAPHEAVGPMATDADVPRVHAVDQATPTTSQLATRQDLEDVERRLLPIEAQMEAMRKEMHRSASEVAAEVRSLTERLGAALPTSQTGPSMMSPIGSRPAAQDSHSPSNQQRLAEHRLEQMEQALAARELALLERERAELQRSERDRSERVRTHRTEAANPVAATASSPCSAAVHEAPQGDAPADIGLRRRLAETSDELQANAEERLKLKRQIAQLQETLQQHEFELAGRPTHRLVQQLRNEISRLERELHPEREALRRVSDTRELIRRDRRVVRRKQSIERRRQAEGLQPFAKVPREDLERTVASVCASLGVVDCEQAEGAVRKMADVVEERLPRLEKFASQVFDMVAEARGKEPHTNTANISVDEALAEVRAWRSAKRAGDAGREDDLRGLRTSLASELRRRPGGVALGAESFSTEPSDAALLRQVAELVTIERQREAMQALYKEAEREMCLDPQQTLHRIIRHFMQLFDIRSLDGCLPSMNTLYTRMSELETLYGATCDYLHLTGPVKPRVAEVIRAMERQEKGTIRSPAGRPRVGFAINSERV